MPYEAHPEFETPPDDTILWRYLDFVKLVDLIEHRRLWFARVNTFEDPLEGTHTDAEVKYLRALPPPSSPLSGPTLVEQYVDMTHKYRETMYVICWRAAITESIAMWDIYGKGSGVVAIKSTVGRFKETLRAHPRKVFIGRVKYVEWSTVAWHLNALPMVMRKDLSYEHEQELRGVLSGLGEVCELPIAPYSLSPGGEYIRHWPRGIEVSCDPEKLVTEIIIGPHEQEMFEQVLVPMLQRYGLAIHVTASDRLKARHPRSPKLE
ncbi:hypothetical protein [Terracidiphilus gabretensis]|uniref:hypothetical protein n=1 Tax=Terracidiphilus gabretensis TaxID=1577687 RepID=UPI00071B1AE2|nr:hypothetical protein [Terracidiphilus gabretensis]